MKRKSIVIIILSCIIFSSFAQYSKMSIQEMVNRRMKAANIDYTQNNFLLKYMERFDESFGSYSNNEFELNEKSAHFKQEIASALQTLSDQKIFVADFQSTFGDYNFESSEFSFNPAKRRKLEDGTVKKYLQVIGVDGSPFSDNRLACGVRINNLDFVNGIKIKKEEAQEFLKNRTEQEYGGSRINRTVYLRVYYVANLNKIDDYLEAYFSYPQFWLQAEPLRIEVWGDKCCKDQLLQSYYPSDTQLSSSFQPLREKLRSIPFVNDELYVYPADNGYETILFNRKLNEDCKSELIQLQCKKTKDTSGQVFLEFRLITNYKYHIKPGFVLKFENDDSGMQYPLVVMKAESDVTASRESEAAKLVVKITQKTIDEIIASNCNCIDIQLNGDPEYEINTSYPNGVSNSVNVIDSSPNVQKITMGDYCKSALYTILMH